MFALCAFIEYPDRPDYTLKTIELLSSFDEARQRSDVLMNEFHEQYGEDIYERATEERPLAVSSNGEVVWRAYIAEAK